MVELYLIALIILFFAFIIVSAMYFTERNKGNKSAKRFSATIEIDKKINNDNKGISMRKYVAALDCADITYVGWRKPAE